MVLEPSSLVLASFDFYDNHEIWYFAFGPQYKILFTADKDVSSARTNRYEQCFVGIWQDVHKLDARGEAT